jgi:hypothetical protein
MEWDGVAWPAECQARLCALWCESRGEWVASVPRLCGVS